ncbi:NAD(P)H-dependent oxidoreductase [Mucilaginibacter robiniae]|uniref:NAD(P)H-dependent oxidoreductase n=1 Tax=Mucilaginibacter robiniae TaxID=2728022 RepID=A0A7L5DUG9_9SPHI|nr:NADPH-dependent FMN reductase [Mucilaginibacter robiniae]QJD94765.1 NAD(P)H-dependent oxidoreductase [Mucilaginibacter robiniae]
MVTIIASTNRPESSTLKLSKYYQQLLSNKGVTSNLFSLEELPANFIQTDMYGQRSNNFQPLQQMVTETQKFLFIIPEYNGSFPGVLKTFVDACNFPESFYDKKAALVGLSSGKYGNIRGIEHFTGVCHYLNMHVMPLKLHIPAIHKELDEQNRLFKEDTIKFVNEQVDKFIKF